jgi:lysophospholipase L1-like esterase
MSRIALWRGIALAAAVFLPPTAFAATPQWCDAPPGWTAILQPLERTAARINAGEPLNIVAIGSSSTVGVGATGPEQAYPTQLQAALSAHFPGLDIHVINRGVSGQDAPEEVARLSADVVALHPDLVIWQVGTNAVLRRDDLSADGGWMREGVALLKDAGIDVVLMDLQYAPRVLDRSSFSVMEDLIADTANDAHVGLFRRFALMRYWQRAHPAEAPVMIGADGLHMTDVGYSCLAANLAAALEANWQSGEKLARRAHGGTDAIARLKQEPFGEFDRWTAPP